MKAWIVALVVGTLGVGFALGRSSVPASSGVAATTAVSAANSLPASSLPTSALPARSVLAQAQAPNDPREVFPLVPGPGDQPGSGPQPSPAPGQGEGECTVLMFRDGQFYRIQPGQPGPNGTEPNGNTPGGDGELFPLEPRTLPTPDAPPFPAPDMRS